MSASAVFYQIPAAAAARISVVEGDARALAPDQPADTLLADIWLPLFGRDREAEVRQMHANTGGSRVYFWGQEMVIADRARRAGVPLSADSVAGIVRDMGLPLIGPAECPNYADRVGLAASRWLRADPDAPRHDVEISV